MLGPRARAAILAIACIVGGAGCGGEPGPDASQAAPGETVEGTEAGDTEAIDALADTQLPPHEGELDEETADATRRRNVTLYWPSLGGDGLMASEITVYDTAATEDLARQILAGLLNESPPTGASRAVPSGTVLRQVYVHRRVAWVNFNARLRDGLGGGSARELATVYSIVDSLAMNLPDVDRVGILIDGQPVDTLNGHVDLSRPLRPDRRRLRARA